MAKKEMNLTTKVYYECQIKPLQGVKNGWVDKLSTSTILNDSGAIKRYFFFIILFLFHF